MLRKILRIFIIMIVVSSTTLQASNPLLKAWKTPHATPPFTSIKTNHYAPALRQGIAEAKAAVESIVNNSDAPTFENTIVALEQASPLLDRTSALLFNMNECYTDDALQQVVLEMSPELTRYSNELYMNEALFARVKAVYEQRTTLNLTPEQLMLLEKTYRHFVDNGALLGEEQKRLFAQYGEELSVLTNQFSANVLAETNDYTLHITQDSNLSGLPADVVAAAREEAERRQLQGWVFTLNYPSYGPFMTYCDNRALRREMWMAYNSRGNHGNDHDNNQLIHRITELRFRMARLLGYDNYASYALADKMAQNVPTVNAFMQKMLSAAIPAAQGDLNSVQAYATQHGADFTLERWDFSYYSEKLKQERYAYDVEVLRPYFPLEQVRQGIFALYGTLYGLSFKENKDIPVYCAEVTAYDVYDGDRFMGVLYLDMYPRSNKSGGAWMTEFRGQHRTAQGDSRPLIQVVCNFSKPVGNKPALLSFDEVETFMHEFGHAMHGMLSDVTYESLSGTNVMHDFVEMPSQVMENWCYEPEFLNTFAHHYQTGATIPSDYIEKIKASKNYLSGWLCLRQLNYGLVDMAFHTLQQAPSMSVEQLEHHVMVELQPVVEGCCSSTAFTHIFSGGYAAGYYGYKWAEALDADIFTRFKTDGIMNPAVGRSFRQEILSKGGTVHPSVLFRNFMGRDPNPDALLLRSGLYQTVTPASDNQIH